MVRSVAAKVIEIDDGVTLLYPQELPEWLEHGEAVEITFSQPVKDEE
jgi:hypothetical protein